MSNNMTQPLVSILIVTYNSERFIRATVNSCLQQTYSNIEVVVWDNASSDTTVKILETIHDSRLRILRGENNLGPYQALNRLLNVAQGAYIAIQDHDDLWLPTKIDEQVAYLDLNPHLLGCGTLTYYFFESKNQLVVPNNSTSTDFVDHTSLLMKRNEMRYNEKHPLPDEFFIRKQLRTLGEIHCLQRPLTIHRIRDDGKNLSSRRVRGNIRGAWAHFTMTGFHDIAGTIMFLIAGFLPTSTLWWMRRHLTLRNSQWFTRDQFTQHTHFTIT